jgi:hypothetical protein
MSGNANSSSLQKTTTFTQLASQHSAAAIRKIDRMQNALATQSVQALNLKNSADYSMVNTS